TLPTLLTSARAWPRIIRVLVVANVAWLAAVAVQAILEPSQLILGSRFTGVTSNPQSAAILLLFGCVLSIWSAMYDPEVKYRRLGLILLPGQIILLAWTGSRMGVISLIIGMLVMLRRQLANSLKFVFIAALMTVALFNVMGDYGLNEAASRLTSGDSSGRTE